MTGARPEQAILSRNTDMNKTAETRAVIEGMAMPVRRQDLVFLEDIAMPLMEIKQGKG